MGETVIDVICDPADLPANGNPIITNTFTADPTVLVHDGAVYLYTCHDEAPDGSQDYVIREWLCFSSADLQTWTAHPSPLRASDFQWSNGRAFASKVIKHGDLFYWFAALADAADDSALGLATSPTPTGPFADLLGHPLVTRADLPPGSHAKSNLDPTVLDALKAPSILSGAVGGVTPPGCRLTCAASPARSTPSTSPGSPRALTSMSATSGIT